MPPGTAGPRTRIPPPPSRKRPLSAVDIVQVLLIVVLVSITVFRFSEATRLVLRKSLAPDPARAVFRLRLGSGALILGIAIELVRPLTGGAPTAVPAVAVHLAALVCLVASVVLTAPLRRMLSDVLDQLDASERVLEGLVEGAGEVFATSDATLDDAGLTLREREIVQLIAQGIVTDREISGLLHISPATSATHVRNILRKTGYSSRQHLLVASLREGPSAG